MESETANQLTHFINQIMNFAKYSFICHLYGIIRDDAIEKRGGEYEWGKCMNKIVLDIICK